ncbi:MAG: hypothetical protein JW839_04185 [Candidatus Lokiarchaeota archaeon]|nr:hypothetical protein [Candidatus Lokiarchaeota archaeon]
MEGDENKQYTGVPAILYTALWHVREMGFLKRMLGELKIKRTSLYVHFDDYPPGGIVTVDPEKGDYEVVAVEAGQAIDLDSCDCAVTGQLKPVVQLLEHDKNLLLGVLGLVLQRKIRIKGLFRLLKAAKLISRCI